MLFLLVVLALETPRVVKLRSTRDLVVFLLLWGLVFVTAVANWARWPGLRPLDWIRIVMQPINRLLS